MMDGKPKAFGGQRSDPFITAADVRKMTAHLRTAPIEPEPKKWKPSEMRDELKPGELKAGQIVGGNAFLVLCGRVPYTGATRQQRRQMQREHMKT
jgi:hypothetical protein